MMIADDMEVVDEMVPGESAPHSPGKKRLPLRRAALMFAFRRALRSLDRGEGVQAQEIANSMSLDMQVDKESVLERLDEIISMALNIKMVNEIRPNCYTLKNPRMLLCGVCGGKKKNLASRNMNAKKAKAKMASKRDCKPKRKQLNPNKMSCGCAKKSKDKHKPEIAKRKSCEAEKCKQRQNASSKPPVTSPAAKTQCPPK